MKKKMISVCREAIPIHGLISLSLILVAVIILGGCRKGIAQTEVCETDSKRILVITIGLEKTKEAVLLRSQSVELVDGDFNALPLADQGKSLQEEITIEIPCGAASFIQEQTAYFHIRESGEITTFLKFFIPYSDKFELGTLYTKSSSIKEIGTVDLSNPLKITKE